MIGDVLKKFFTYGVGNVLQAALNFILLPIFLRFFSPQEYGVISALLVLVSLFTLFAGGGILNGLFRLYFEADGLERKGLVGATWLWYLIAAGLGGMAFYTQAAAVSMLLFHTKAYAPVVQRAGAVFFFSMLHQVPFSVLRLRKRAGAYIGLSLFNFLLDFAFKMVFIVVLGWGINGYFESGAIAHLLTGCLISLVVYRDVRFACNLTFFKQLFRLGLPYVVSGLSVWALEVSDRLLLTRFAGEAAAGLYSLAGNLAKIFQILLSGPISLLIDPFFFAYAAEHPLAATRKLLERTLIYFFLAGACLYLAIALGAGELLRDRLWSPKGIPGGSKPGAAIDAGPFPLFPDLSSGSRWPVDKEAGDNFGHLPAGGRDQRRIEPGGDPSFWGFGGCRRQCNCLFFVMGRALLADGQGVPRLL